MVDELVKKLSEGKHKVTIGHRGESYKEIKERIENGYVYVKFTETKGETELGINIDLNNTNLHNIDFDEGKGLIHIEGTANLNYNQVRCIADIDLGIKTGQGYLVISNE